jgi:hypothetical protein
MWNVRRLYMAVSFMRSAKELSKYKADLRVQEVRWGEGGTESVGE